MRFHIQVLFIAVYPVANQKFFFKLSGFTLSEYTLGG